MSTKSSSEIPAEASFFFRNYADKGANPDRDRTRLSESRYLAPFNINEMHPGQRRLLTSRDQMAKAIESPSRLADLIADIVASSKNDLQSNSETRLEHMVNMYHASLHEHGFQRRKWQELTSVLNGLNDSGLVVWIVAGCQGAPLRDRRADIAANALHEIYKALPNLSHRIIFCGAHPPADRVEEPNEAAELQGRFMSVIQKICPSLYGELREPGPKLQCICENESTTTALNIKLGFEKAMRSVLRNTAATPQDVEADDSGRIAEDTPSEETVADAPGTEISYATIIVSNDFHLIRLSRDFRRLRRSHHIKIAKDKLITYKEFELINGLKLNGLLLLGSEYFDSDETYKVFESMREIGNTSFLKRVYFEALSDFFRRNYFLNDAEFLSKSSTYVPANVDAMGYDAECKSLIVPMLNQEDTVTFVMLLNRLVFHPVQAADMQTAVENAYFSYAERGNQGESTEKVEDALRLVHRLGGRFTQPTVRVSGDPKLSLANIASKTWEAKFELARNYEGVSLLAQLGMTDAVNDIITRVLRHHQMLSLHVSVLYCFERNSCKYTLLRRRASNRYVDSHKVEASAEGPVYLEDFGNRDELDLRRPVLRQLKKEYLRELAQNKQTKDILKKWSNTQVGDWSRDFFALGYSQSSHASTRHSCVHGLLHGPDIEVTPSPDLPNRLIDQVACVEISSDGFSNGIIELAGEFPPRITATAMITMLMTLKKIASPDEMGKFKERWGKSVFE